MHGCACMYIYVCVCVDLFCQKDKGQAVIKLCKLSYATSECVNIPGPATG